MSSRLTAPQAGASLVLSTLKATSMFASTEDRLNSALVQASCDLTRAEAWLEKGKGSAAEVQVYKERYENARHRLQEYQDKCEECGR